MKKEIALIVCVCMELLGVLPAYADGWPTRIYTALRRVSSHTQQVSKTTRVTQSAVQNLTEQVVEGAEVPVVTNVHPPFVNLGVLSTQPSRGDMRRVSRASRDIRYSAVQNALDRTLRGTLRAHGKFSFLFNSIFSGTIFKVEYNGQTEIYGVVATHVLAEVPHGLISWLFNSATLHRVFDLETYDKNGNAVPLKGEIVQLGAYGTIDLSLVRILPESIEKLGLEAQEAFSPLELSTSSVAQGEILRSQGFHEGSTVYDYDRLVLEISPFSLRTTLAATPIDRAGLCGGPVCNEQGQLTSVHTGSRPGAGRVDVGYATPVSYLELLVQAYHNGGQAFYPFKIKGVTIGQLRVDEYPTKITLFDFNGEVLAEKRILDKFSYKRIERMISTFRPRYVEFTLGQIRWSQKKQNLVEFVPEVRRIKYDFVTDMPVEPVDDPLRHLDRFQLDD